MYGQTAGTYAEGKIGQATGARTLGEVQQVGHIPQAVQEHGKLLEVLNDEIGVLEGRIGAVLRPSPPSPAGGAERQPFPTCSQLAEGLQGMNQRLHAAIMRVRDLAARADV